MERNIERMEAALELLRHMMIKESAAINPYIALGDLNYVLIVARIQYLRRRRRMSTLLTLYEIKEEFLQLYELALSDDDEQAFLDTLEALKGELEVKASGYIHVIKQLEMEANECDKVVEAFEAKKNKRLNSIKRMKEALISAMDIAEVDSLPAGEYTLKIAKNGGVEPMKIDGEVPDNFMKVIYEPDNKKIREALKNGEALDFAHLEERGRHLNIK